MPDEFFRYRVDWRVAPFWIPFGVRPGRDGVHVDVDRDVFRATYGFFKVETSLGNVSGAHVTTDYRWYTAVGARLSFVDDGLTFGTNHDRGVCVHFREPVRGGPTRRTHSALTVTVENCGALVDRLGGA
jgi:hypothetical protein